MSPIYQHFIAHSGKGVKLPIKEYLSPKRGVLKRTPGNSTPLVLVKVVAASCILFDLRKKKKKKKLQKGCGRDWFYTLTVEGSTPHGFSGGALGPDHFCVELWLVRKCGFRVVLDYSLWLAAEKRAAAHACTASCLPLPAACLRQCDAASELAPHYHAKRSHVRPSPRRLCFKGIDENLDDPIANPSIAYLTNTTFYPHSPSILNLCPARDQAPTTHRIAHHTIRDTAHSQLRPETSHSTTCNIF